MTTGLRKLAKEQRDTVEERKSGGQQAASESVGNDTTHTHTSMTLNTHSGRRQAADDHIVL